MKKGKITQAFRVNSWATLTTPSSRLKQLIPKKEACCFLFCLQGSGRNPLCYPNSTSRTHLHHHGACFVTPTSRDLSAKNQRFELYPPASETVGAVVPWYTNAIGLFDRCKANRLAHYGGAYGLRAAVSHKFREKKHIGSIKCAQSR